jgi:lauroyl/myristoyl acyltransferase
MHIVWKIILVILIVIHVIPTDWIQRMYDGNSHLIGRVDAERYYDATRSVE